MTGAAPRFGPYVGVRELARGGMGAVWEAVHEGTGARHAVKVALGAPDPELALRFRREAEVLGRLDHRHIARAHAADLAGGAPWIAQDLLPGGSLQARLERGPLAADEALAIARKLAGALAHAHARGVLHRDLKPDNVLFDEQGEPVLVDFGVGLTQDGEERLTRTGALLGTPEYMAPEQARGLKEVDARTDVFGLGALLHAMLAGQAPFRGGSTFAALQAASRGAAPPLPAHAPPWLAAVVARAMAPRPAERFPDAATLERALAAGAGGGRPHRAWPAAAAGAAALLTAVAVRAGASRPGGPPEPPAPPRTTVTAPAPPADARSAADLAWADAAARRDWRQLRTLERGAPPSDPRVRAAVASAWLARARELDAPHTVLDATHGEGAARRAARAELGDVFDALGRARRADRLDELELLVAAERTCAALWLAPTNQELAALVLELRDREGASSVVTAALAARADANGASRLQRFLALWAVLRDAPEERLRGPLRLLRDQLGHRVVFDANDQGRNALARELLAGELERPDAQPQMVLEDWVVLRLHHHAEAPWSPAVRDAVEEVTRRLAALRAEHARLPYSPDIQAWVASALRALDEHLRHLEAWARDGRAPRALVEKWR